VLFVFGCRRAVSRVRRGCGLVAWYSNRRKSDFGSGSASKRGNHARLYVQYLGYPTYPNRPSPEWRGLPGRVRVSGRKSESSQLSNLAWGTSYYVRILPAIWSAMGLVVASLSCLMWTLLTRKYFVRSIHLHTFTYTV
jgi:hypothetical protein